MAPITGLGAGITRRMAQSPQMRVWVEDAVRRITEEVHARRVKEWAGSDNGQFPNLVDSRQEAIAELALLCAALGPLAALDPKQFDYGLTLSHTAYDLGDGYDYTL